MARAEKASLSFRSASTRAGAWTAFAVCVALGLSDTDSFAQDLTPLRGHVHIAGATPVDPPPREAKNTHAYLTIEGAAALRMYRAMKARAEENPCLGGRMKRAGPLMCTLAENGKDATCDFSVDLVKGALDDGNAC